MEMSGQQTPRERYLVSEQFWVDWFCLMQCSDKPRLRPMAALRKIGMVRLGDNALRFVVLFTRELSYDRSNVVPVLSWEGASA